MQESMNRKLFLGFIHIHILYHAKKEPFYGSWMIEELKEHGYEMSAGTLYPMLHHLEESKILKQESKVVEGKVRKYYEITEKGEILLKELQHKAKELLKEVDNEKD